MLLGRGGSSVFTSRSFKSYVSKLGKNRSSQQGWPGLCSWKTLCMRSQLSFNYRGTVQNVPWGQNLECVPPQLVSAARGPGDEVPGDTPAAPQAPRAGCGPALLLRPSWVTSSSCWHSLCLSFLIYDTGIMRRYVWLNEVNVVKRLTHQLTAQTKLWINRVTELWICRADSHTIF